MNDICICGHTKGYHGIFSGCRDCLCAQFILLMPKVFTPAPQSWATELETLWEDTPHYFGTNRLCDEVKAFIAEQITRAEKRRIKEYEEYVLPAAIAVAEEKEHAATLHTVRERIEEYQKKFIWDNAGTPKKTEEWRIIEDLLTTLE